MKKMRIWVCLLAAMAMCTNLAGCGSQKETVSEPDENTSIVDSEPDEDDAWMFETDDGSDDAPIDLDNITIQGKETTAPAETEATEDTNAVSTVAETAVETGASTNAQTQAPFGGSSPVQTEAPKETQAQQPTATEAATQAATEAPTEAPTTEPVDPEDVVAAVIDLNNGVSYEGSNVTVEGNVVNITGEGTYILSGTLPDGMIRVNTTLKVKLKLNGVSISNSTGPAILVEDAKRLTITLIEGTQNYLSDGPGAAAYDGVIFSNDTIEIKGAGGLHIVSNFEHGISSDDDIVVKNGNIDITAVKTGMMANDDITVTGGNLHVVGGTNGIKSKGTMHISGGSVWTMGGPKETKSALYCVSGFALTGGSIYAIGCGATEPDPTLSTQYAMTVTFSPSLVAGTQTSIASNGVQLLDCVHNAPYNTVFVSTPAMYDGMNFSVFNNGAEVGNFTTAGNMTYVTVGG